MMNNSIFTFISSLSLMRVERGVTGSAINLEASYEGSTTFVLLLLAAKIVVKEAAPNPSPANLVAILEN